MIGFIAKKIGMTQLINDKGIKIPVTFLSVSDHYFTQIKSLEVDGYNAIQVGLEISKKTNKPLEKKLNNAGIKSKLNKFFELKTESQESVGKELDLSLIKVGDDITVIGVSKGKGFSGTVKRHGFSTGPKTHGSHNYRLPGSIGSAYPQRVVKGKKMAGRMGFSRTTVKGLKIFDLDLNDRIIGITGPIPGPKKSHVLIKVGSDE